MSIAVKEAKVVFVPIGQKMNKKGELKTIFARTGIRVDMVDGSWWFFHFKYGTWSKHWTGLESGPGWMAGAVEVERKESYSLRNLQRNYRHCPALLAALEEGKEMALVEEAEKRLAA